MKKLLIFWITCICFILIGCGSGGDSSSSSNTSNPMPPDSAKELRTFSINGHNGIIRGTTVEITLPFASNVTKLVAKFTIKGQAVTVAGVKQVSGQTARDFSEPVVYRVHAADNSYQDYTVRVTVVSDISAKAIKYFALDNIGGTIQDYAINVRLPYGSSLTNLAAIFVSTGQKVTVKGVKQDSGKTLNSFNEPVEYRVYAADGSYQDYTVTVTVVSDVNAKEIDYFAFESNVGTINGTQISVTLPYGTIVTSLIASFSTTGKKVMVDNKIQDSDQTPNDFSKRVVYRVYAANDSYQDYTVTVTVDKQVENPNFLLLGNYGQIDRYLAATNQYQNLSHAMFNLQGIGVDGNGKFIAMGDVGFLTSSNGSDWIKPPFVTNSPMQTPLAVAANKQGLVVAVGTNNSIWTSTDSINWTPLARTVTITHLFGVTANESGLFVAVGDNITNGIIYTSSNGTDWSSVNPGTTKPLKSVTVSNSGRFIAVGMGGAIVTSTNGSSWTSVDSPTTQNLLSVTVSSDGRFVAVGSNGTVVKSSDGVSWTTSDSTTTKELFKVAASSSGRFIAVGASGTIVISNDGSVWAASDSGTTQDLYAVIANSSKIVAVGASGIIVTSSAGINWSTVPSLTAVALNSAAVSSSGKMIIVGNSGFIASANKDNLTNFNIESAGSTNNLYGVAVNNTKFVIVGANGTILASSNGQNWDPMNSGSTKTLRAITINSNGLWVTVGNSGTILTSSNGQQWTPAISNTSQNLNAVAVTRKGMFIAVGANGTIVTSTDGSTWINIGAASKTTQNLQAVAVNSNGMIVAVGGNGTIVTSDNGSDWSNCSVTTTLTLLGVAVNGNDKFMAAGSSGVIFTSDNGISWEKATQPSGVQINGLIAY